MKEKGNHRFFPGGSAGGMPAERFLLIREWGAGLWWEMEHVIWQLLFAEATNRIPVVFWGQNSLYGGAETVNAFEQFFLPVSVFTVHDLRREDYTFFPDCWNWTNLLGADPLRFARPWHFDVLPGREETVLVSDSWFSASLIQGIINDAHPAYGLDLQEIYRYVFNKYIILRTYIYREIIDFYANHMAGRPHIAIHVRGSDKISEIEELEQINNQYDGEINGYLAQNDSAGIFLLTESAEILRAYMKRYKERLVYTDCQRVTGEGPLYEQAANKKRMGIEVLTDTFLAIMCDAFIGNAFSNVSRAVARLKSWPASHIKLLSG